jgi:hypothetical protein
MKSLLTTLFALSLAACADFGNLGRERATDLMSPTRARLVENQIDPREILGGEGRSIQERGKRKHQYQLIVDGMRERCVQGSMRSEARSTIETEMVHVL